MATTTLWHEGEPFISQTPIHKSFNLELIRPPRGKSNGRYWIKVIVDKNGNAWYSIRYWTSEGQTPYTALRLISTRKFNGDNTQVELSDDGNLVFFTKENDFKEPQFFVNPGDLKDIQEIEKENSPKKKVLIGNSLREILHAEKDLFPRKLMTLAEHEQAVIDNKINFERIDAIYLLDFLRAHCIRMNQHGVTVMLTLGDRDRPNIGDYREIIAATCDLPNIIYDTENELGDETKWVDIAGERAKYITDLGLPAAGGGFGNSTFGEANDRLFEQKYPMCQYKKIHRPYPPLKLLLDFVEKQKELGKKIICDELLWDHSVPCIEDPERYIRALKDAGVYGMNIYDGQFKLAGRLCQELNL